MIIGFHGCKGVGKDTAAQFLIDTYDFNKVAFADPLKEAVAALFDMTKEQVDTLKENNDVKVAIMTEVKGSLHAGNIISWRGFLQRFGTEMGRETFHRDFWVDLWEDHLYKNSMHEDDIVVTDVRFKNEAEKIQHLGGVVVRITRPGHEPDGHKSEEPLPTIMIDAEIHNNSTLDDFHVDVHHLYKGLNR